MTTQMNPTNPLESARVLWSAADEAFFRITAELFSPAYAMGAGVLLASYDQEPVAPDPRPTTPAKPTTPATPAARPAPAATATQQ
jgi:hypothetical protein